MNTSHSSCTHEKMLCEEYNSEVSNGKENAGDFLLISSLSSSFCMFIVFLICPVDSEYDDRVSL